MTKMVQLQVGGPNKQLPDVTDKESCSVGVPFTTTSPQAASTPIGKVQELRQAPDTQCNGAENHSKNRRTSTRRLTSYRSDGVPSAATASSSPASCLLMSQSPFSSSLKFPSTFETESCSVESGAFKVPSIADTSESRIICRLPLDRLKSILSSLDISERSSHSPAINDVIQESSKLEDAVEHETASSKVLQQPGELQPFQDDYVPLYKLLCLYCERTFSNQKLMFKHTDRVHKLSKERRSSSRVVTTANNVDISLCCTFCCKGRTLKPTSDDLPQLFKHLVAVHSDRYYACEQCILRFPCEEAREAHMEAIHPAANGTRPKSKAALKAFSNNRSNATNHSLHQPSTSIIKSSKTSKKNTTSGGATSKSSIAPDNLNLEGDPTIRTNRTNVEDQNEKDHNADTETLAAGGQTVRLRSSPRNTMGQSLSRGDGKSKVKTIVYKKSERLLMRNAEPMLLSRLGIAQHRLPRQSRRLLAIASSCASGEVLSTSSSTSSSSSSSSPSSSSSTSSSSTLVTSTNTAGRSSSRKKHIAMNNEDEPPQLENCYIKLTKLKNIRSTLNSFPITTTADDCGVVDLANIISDSSSGRSKANDFAPTTTTACAAIGTGGTNGRGGAGCGYTIVNPNGGNDANSNTMFSGNSSIISSSVSNTSNHGSSFGIFDEDFYENVSSNVNINLCCYLDGKLQTTLTNTLSPTVVASPTAPTLRSIVVRSPVATDSKIYEATNLPAGGVMFPTLLTIEQYGTDSVAGQAALATSAVKTKKPITKNSWKWKWDFVKKYKYVNENGRIVKKIKQPTLGLRDLSKLDMWTQLTMRTKHEEIRRRFSPDDAHDQPQGETDAVLRQNKQAMVDQLDQILDARLLPQIDLEQNDQRIIKVEQVDEQSLAEITEQTISKHSELTSLGLETKRVTPENVAPAFLVSLANGRRTDDCVSSSNMISETDFMKGLKLMKLVRHNNLLPVVLSGEWARPRCYICYGCGDKFNSLKQVEEHRIFRHPHVYSMFYEIVGRELIEKRLYKHFFIPFTALAAHRLHYLRLAEAEPDTERFDPTTDGTFGLNIEIKNEDSSSNEATSVSTTTSAALASSSRSSISSSSITTLATLMDASGDCVTSLTRYPPTLAEDEGESRTVVCSKCQKECQNMLVLYAHMLHCSNDYVWLQAKKRMKYRRVRRRRGGNRNTSSAGGGLSCAASLLATVRKAQQQHLQNAVEKSETASNTSTSSSKESGGSLSSDVTNSSNTSSSSTSNSSIGSSSHSPSKKKSKSPKPKDSDSDIVKRLLANLPAKRNSRQIILQTTKQINKRSNVTGRTPLVASSKGAKGVAMKCRKTLGTTVATRMSVTKDNKKAKISSRLAVGSGASRNEDTPVPLEASSGAALSGTPLSSSKLRSTSSEHSHSPPGEATNTVSGSSTRSKWTSAKADKKKNISKQRAKREKKSILMKEIEGDQKILQWKKTRRQFRRMVTNGKRILRSGCSRDLSGSGRKQLVTKSMKLNNGKSNSKRSRRSSVVRSSKSPSKDVALLATDIQQVDCAHVEDIKLVQTDGQKREVVEETLKTMNERNEKQKDDLEESSSSNIQPSNLATTEESDNICRLSEKVEKESINTPTATSMEVQEDLPEQLDEDSKKLCERSELFATSHNILKNHQDDNFTCSPSPSVQSDSNWKDMNVAEAVISSSSSVINCSNSRPPIDSCSQSPASKRKPKKLNDCIAMLTGKLSEKLGVDFFNSQLQRKKSETKEDMCQAVSEKERITPTSSLEMTVATQTMTYPMLPDKTPSETSNPEINGPTFHTSCNDKFCTPMPCKNAIATMSTVVQTLNLELQNPPQTTPVPLVMNTRTSEARSTSVRASALVPPSKNVSLIQVEQNVFDEPLNLSKTSVDPRNSSKPNLMQTGSQIHQQYQLQQQMYPQQHQHISCPVSPVRSTESHLQNHTHRKQPVSHHQNYLHSHLVQTPLHQNPPRNTRIGSTAAMSSAALDHTQSTASSCTLTAKAGSGNLSSIKLPPGLIIERVEYKQSRPLISKEAPSVTIVARHRQVEPSSFPLLDEATENRKTVAATPQASVAAGNSTPPCVHSLPMCDSQQQTSMQQHYYSGREHMRKVFDGCSSHSVHPPSVSGDQLSTSVRVLPSEKPTQTVVPFVENRISVTITEAKLPERLQDVRIRPRNNSASASYSLPSGQAQPLKARGIDKAMPPCFSSKTQHSASSSMFLPTQTLSSFCHRQMPQSPTDGGASITPDKPQHTTLIIPHVPMPYTPPQAAPSATKRSRRKSFFISPTDSPSAQGASSSCDAKKTTSVNNTMDALRTILAPAPSSFPSSVDSLCRANMLASMSFSLLPPGLLGGPHMGLDLQRLAAVGLPAHLKPPVIPPLTVPVSTASSATLLEKILQPTRTEALSNALEHSLKNAQVKPSEQLATTDVHVPFLNNQDAGSTFEQHKMDDSGINSLEQLQPPDMSGISPHMVEKSTTQASSGKSKKPATTGRSTKRTSLGDDERKALMEQIWNASIVDAMMEKDANFEVSRMMEKSTIPVQLELVNCDDGMMPRGLQVPLLEKNDSAKVGLSEPRLDFPQCDTTQKKPIEDANDLFRPRNKSINNEKRQHNRKNSHEECEWLQQQKDQTGTQVLSMQANADIPVEVEAPPPSELNVLKGLPSSLDRSMQAEVGKLERSGEKRPGEKDFVKICSNEHKTIDDTKNNDPRSELVENVKQPEENPETDCATGDAGSVSDISQPEHTTTTKLDNPSPTERVTPTPKVIRKRRKNELASILSDQLLESFKEVDKSRLNDLKLLHDITCETPDVKFTLEQIPQLAKRKSNPRLPELVPQSASDPSKASVVSSATKKGGTKKVARDANTPMDDVDQRDSEKVSESSEIARNGMQCVGSEKRDHEDLKGDTKLEHGSRNYRATNRKEVSAPIESTKQPTFAPTRRTRKLSVDIERLPPTVVAKMSQKILSQKNAGLDIEVPKMRTNVIGKITKNKGKDKCSVPPEESLSVKNMHSEVTTVDDELGRNNASKTKKIVNVETSVACTLGKDCKTSKLKQGQQSLVDDDTQTLGTEKHTCQYLPSSVADSVRKSISEETKKMITSSATVVAIPKKRERRKSVFVDRNMAKYVERDTEDEDRLHSVSGSCKDDLSLTSRRGMRSQVKTDFTRMDTFIETSMNPRDPRRRIVRKRIEEERAAAVTASKTDNKESSKSENLSPDAPTKENIQKHTGIVSDMAKNTTAYAVLGLSLTPNTQLTKPEVGKNAPLRRISSRRASVFVRSPTPPAPVPSPTVATEEQKACSSEARKIGEDENLRTIGNETKRIYRRRASIYQVPAEMLQLELDDIEKQEPEKKKKPSLLGPQRSKTPGPGDWNRRTQLRINGKPEPSIESLLLQATNSSDCCQPRNALNGPKRRTTKNSQIAETVSKLFNIQEEIMLIDSTRRKPKKPNTAPLSSLASPLSSPVPKVADIAEASADSVIGAHLDRSREVAFPKGLAPIKALTAQHLTDSIVLTGIKDNTIFINDIQPSPLPASSPPPTLPPPPPPPRKSISFSNDEDDSPKVINELVKNILKNARDSDTSNDSEDDNMSLACFVAQKVTQGVQRREELLEKAQLDGGSLTDMYIPARAMSVADDDSTTYTDGMDDDLMSVTTELPPSTGNMYGGRGRKKRRQLIRGSKRKRQQAKAKAKAPSEDKHMLTFNCDLCRKVFKKQDAYNKHRMTLTHIAKLSEQEYIQSQQKQQQQEEQQKKQQQPLPGAVPYHISKAQNDEHNEAQSFSEDQEVPHSSSSVQPVDSLHETIDRHATSSMLLAYPQLEDAEADPVLNRKVLHKHSLNALSQEEKLFYECCSMLKESNTSEGDTLNVTASLKTNELENAESMPPLIVPVEGEDRVEDIQYPLPVRSPSLYMAQATIPVAESMASQNTEHSIQSTKKAIQQKANFQSLRYVCGWESLPAPSCGETSKSNKSDAAENYGNISPQNSTKSTSTTSSSSNAKIKTKGALKGYDNFKVSIPMTGIIMSANTGGVVPDTIDENGEGSAGTNAKESRLDTLADVALCGDIPKEFGVYDCTVDLKNNTTGIEYIPSPVPSNVATLAKPETNKEQHDTEMVNNTSMSQPECQGQKRRRISEQTLAHDSKAIAVDSSIAVNDEKDCETKHRGTRSYRLSVGRSSMSRKRRKIEQKQKQPTSKGAREAGETLAHGITCQRTTPDDDDVYAFQDSPSDDALPGTYSSKKLHDVDVSSGTQGDQQQLNPATGSPVREDQEDSQVSSLSFSDRDDFVYGTHTMSDEDEEEEEGKSSSNSSGQTTPKRKTKADVQKKSLIMGRIFKKGGKREKQRENIATKADMVASCVGSKASAMDPSVAATTKTAMAKDFDKLFDTLKNASSQAETDVDRIKRPAADEHNSVISEKEPNGIFDGDIMEDKMREYLERHNPTRHDGSEMSNRLRRTATVRQKKLTETWDSDEYEDFHSDDIMGLIDRADDSEKNANDEALSTLAERADTTESKKSVCEPYIVGLSLKPRSDETERQQVKEMEHHGSELMGKSSVPLTENKQPASTMDVVVTDDTIRKVMESVILETMNKKGAPMAGTNRKSSTKSHTLSNRTSRITTTSENHGAHVCKDKEDSQANTVDRHPDDTQELTTSLNEHVLESSVVISSQTITTKFKQKLNISRRNTTNRERGRLKNDSNTIAMKGTLKESKNSKPSPSPIDPILTNTESRDNSLISINSFANNNNNIHNNNNNNHSNTSNTNKVKQSRTANSSKLNTSKPGSKAKGRTGNESSFVVAKHSGRGRPPMAMTTGGKQKKSAPRKMKNVAYDPDSDYEHSIKYKKVKRKLLESDIEANLKIEQLQSSLNSDSSILLSTPRRKRNAGDMLYYWSSSSDEEELSDEGGFGICDRTATKEEKLHPPRVNKSSAVEKQSRDSIKPRMKNSESTGDILLADNANNGDDAGNVGHVDYRAALTKSSARQPSDVGSFEPNGGNSKQNSTKPPPNIFESMTTATTGGTNDEGTITGKHVRGRKQQLQQSTEGKPSFGYDNVPDTGSNSENLQQHGWIVGDSHKKLVTLLAHAKGKQDSRKTANHRRK